MIANQQTEQHAAESAFARMRATAHQVIAQIPHAVLDPDSSPNEIRAHLQTHRSEAPALLVVALHHDRERHAVWATIKIDGHADYPTTPVVINEKAPETQEIAEHSLEEKLKEVSVRFARSLTEG